MGDKFHDECAVVGAVNCPEASKYCYLSLYAMQHRGQEGAGIVSTDGCYMYSHRDMGLVADVFSDNELHELHRLPLPLPVGEPLHVIPPSAAAS